MYLTASKQKFIANFDLKQIIVVYYVLLEWMLANALSITKIFKALQFLQKSYMKTFMDTLVSKRSKAKVKAKKEIYKLV